MHLFLELFIVFLAENEISFQKFHNCLQMFNIFKMLLKTIRQLCLVTKYSLFHFALSSCSLLVVCHHWAPERKSQTSSDEHK